MGSCCSKLAVAPEATVSEKTAQSAGPANTQSSREAAAKAAELRYQAQQEKLAASQTKLKAMEKISRREKGL